MKKTPYQPELERATTVVAPSSTTATVSGGHWRDEVPVLQGARLRLREVRREDAPSLLATMTPDEVSRFITAPPSTIDGFQRFISWAQAQRRCGEYVCFAVVPEGMDTAVGVFQVRAIEPGLGTAEWGFVLGAPFWGQGLFAEAARLTLRFAFEIMGVHRLEARAAVANGRGNGALRKMGAVQEGILRRSFARHGTYHDQVLWSILAEDWQFMCLQHRPRIH